MLSDTRSVRRVALDSAALDPPRCPSSNPSSATSEPLHFQKSPYEVPRAAGAKYPTHTAIKYPPLRPETAGFYCLSVLGPDVPTQGVAGPRSLRRLQGVSFPEIPRPLACGHIRAASASTVRGLSLCLCASSSLCVCLGPAGSPAGRPQSGFSGVFLMIALRDAPHSSCRIRIPAVPVLLTADIVSVGMLVRFLHWEAPAPPDPVPTNTRTHCPLKGSLKWELFWGLLQGRLFSCQVFYISVEVWVFPSYFRA